ncbi:MAG: TPM domain-containing protein [Bdellovibrionota bacterium]
MAAGKSKIKHSPIIEAIAAAETGTTGEIRVHLSRRLIERDAFGRAQKLFKKFGMSRTTHRNGVLLYVNMRRRKFAIIGDEGIHKTVGQRYWEELAKNLGEDLRSTHLERAVAMAVLTIGETLRKFFPLEPGTSRTNEMPDEVSED